eukprot:7313623-Pyramimonas_sp.AAC.1
MSRDHSVTDLQTSTSTNEPWRITNNIRIVVGSVFITPVLRPSRRRPAVLDGIITPVSYSERLPVVNAHRAVSCEDAGV